MSGCAGVAIRGGVHAVEVGSFAVVYALPSASPRIAN